MKNKMKIILIPILLMFFSLMSFAQLVEPGGADGVDPNDSGTPVGGGAPIDGGVSMIIGLSVLYLSKRTYKSYMDNSHSI